MLNNNTPILVIEVGDLVAAGIVAAVLHLGLLAAYLLHKWLTRREDSK